MGSVVPTPGSALTTAAMQGSGAENAQVVEVRPALSLKVGQVKCGCSEVSSSSSGGNFDILKIATEPPHWSALVLKVKVTLGGKEMWWKALVDTGAGVNLVKSGLVPEELWENAKHPLTFQTASGEILAGGRRGAHVMTSFRARKSRRARGHVITRNLWMYEGDIQYDCILSYRFLASQRIVVVPHRQCLLWGKSEVPGESPSPGASVAVDVVVSENVAAVKMKDLAGHYVPRPANWKTSSYTLLDEWFQRVCEWSGVKPEVDVFASEANRRCARYWDRTINAFNQVWSHLTLWMNPPFEAIAEVVEKLIDDGGRGLLLVPIWESEEWWQSLETVTLDWWDLPRDCPIFQDEAGRILPQPKWGTRVCVVDGTLGDTGEHRRFVSVVTVNMPRYLSDFDRSAMRRALTIGGNSVLDISAVQGSAPREDDSDRGRMIEKVKTEVPGVWGDIPKGVPKAERPDWALHRIKLKPGAVAKSFRPFRLALERKEALVSLLEEMANQGWIEEVEGDAEGWGSPAFPVPKKLLTFRLVIDYRYLNSVS